MHDPSQQDREKHSADCFVTQLKLISVHLIWGELICFDSPKLCNLPRWLSAKTLSHNQSASMWN